MCSGTGKPRDGRSTGIRSSLSSNIETPRIFEKYQQSNLPQRNESVLLFIIPQSVSLGELRSDKTHQALDYLLILNTIPKFFIDHDSIH